MDTHRGWSQAKHIGCHWSLQGENGLSVTGRGGVGAHEVDKGAKDDGTGKVNTDSDNYNYYFPLFCRTRVPGPQLQYDGRYQIVTYTFFRPGKLQPFSSTHMRKDGTKPRAFPKKTCVCSLCSLYFFPGGCYHDFTQASVLHVWLSFKRHPVFQRAPVFTL